MPESGLSTKSSCLLVLWSSWVHNLKVWKLGFSFICPFIQQIICFIEVCLINKNLHTSNACTLMSLDIAHTRDPVRTAEGLNRCVGAGGALCSLWALVLCGWGCLPWDLTRIALQVRDTVLVPVSTSPMLHSRSLEHIRLAETFYPLKTIARFPTPPTPL